MTGVKPLLLIILESTNQKVDKDQGFQGFWSEQLNYLWINLNNFGRTIQFSRDTTVNSAWTFSPHIPLLTQFSYFSTHLYETLHLWVSEKQRQNKWSYLKKGIQQNLKTAADIFCIIERFCKSLFISHFKAFRMQRPTERAKSQKIQIKPEKDPSEIASWHQGKARYLQAWYRPMQYGLPVN